MGDTSGRRRWLGKIALFTIPGLKNLCYTDADWASDKTSRRSTSGGVVTLGGGPQLLGEEAEECRTVKLGERVDGSWVQLQCYSCDRQSECHRSLAAPRPVLRQSTFV